MTNKNKGNNKEIFAVLLDRYLDLERGENAKNSLINRYKKHRLLSKMIDAAEDFEDNTELLCLLSPKSKHYQKVFDRAHALSVTFEDNNLLLSCYNSIDDNYCLVLQELRQKANTLEDWYIIYDNIEYLIDLLKDETLCRLEKGLPSTKKLIDLVGKYTDQLRDALLHIINMSNTVEELNYVIFMLTNGSHQIEDIIKKRDLLIKK